MNALQIFDRILDPVTDAFSPEVARRVLSLKADEELQNRLDELASKASDGTLSHDEKDEYSSYVSAIDLVSILQAKSQRVLEASQ